MNKEIVVQQVNQIIESEGHCPTTSIAMNTNGFHSTYNVSIACDMCCLVDLCTRPMSDITKEKVYRYACSIKEHSYDLDFIFFDELL